MPGTVLRPEKMEVSKTENSPSRKLQSRVGETDIKQVSDYEKQGKGTGLPTVPWEVKASLFEGLKTKGIGGSSHLKRQE